MTRILFITPMPPWPTSSGANQRSNLLLRALKHCGDTDVFLIDEFHHLSRDTMSVLERDYSLVGCVTPMRPGHRWPWRLVARFAPKFVDGISGNVSRVLSPYRSDPLLSSWLRHRLANNKYDLIVVRYFGAAMMAGIPAEIPAIVDIDDLETQMAQARADLPDQVWWKRLFFRWHAKRLQMIVPKLMNRFEYLFISSHADASAVRPDRVSVLPNLPFDPCENPLPPNHSSKMVLMVGALFHKPNVEGVDQFLANIWPSVHRAHPDATFRIVGAGMSESCRTRWQRLPGVDAVGYVKEVKSHYEASAFSVTPVFRGGGTKIKLLESLLLGRTCVTSTHGLRGYEDLLGDDKSLFVAKTDDAFAKACSALLSDLDLRDKLAAHGRLVVMENFTFERFQTVVRVAVNKVLKHES